MAQDTDAYTLLDPGLVFDVAASLSTFAGDAVTPLIDFAESSVTPLLEFLPGDATIEFPDVTGGLIDATVSAPDLDTTGTVTGPNVLGSFEEDPFFTVGFDLDGLATTLAGIPGLEDDKTEQTGPFAVTLGYNLLDLTLQTALTVTQSFDLTAEDFLFDITRDDTNEVVASDVSAGDSFVFTVPTGVGDALSFSAGVDPVATLNNQTGLGIDVDFLIDALSASFGFSAEFAGIEFDIVDLEFGPVYQDSVDVFDAQLATIFDDTFPLVGFQEQTFGFDLFVA